MMPIVFTLAVLLSQPLLAQEPRTNFYFGQPVPGDTPTVFAPGLISLPGRFEQFLAFSPDERVLTYGVSNATWTAFSLYQMSWDSGQWSEPIEAPYVGRNEVALTSAHSFGDGQVFFTGAPRPVPPVDIWWSTRDGEVWSEPLRMDEPVNSGGNEFEVTVAGTGTLYFSSTREGGEGDLDLYRAVRIRGSYPAVENLGPAVNSPAGDDLPFIAPDESYLVFASDRPGGFGERDLYVSFQSEGEWTPPQNLGSAINTASWEIYPSISPDGTQLFFTRREGWQPTTDSDIYWVSASIIEELRVSALEP